MNVCHVISSLNLGGAETVLYRLCTADRRNHHVVISLMGEGHYGPLLRQAGVDVECLDMPPGRVTGRGVRRLWRIIRARRPDVVQTWMFHSDLVGGLAARAAGVPRVYWGIRSGKLLWTSGQRITSVLRLLNAAVSWVVPTAVICNSAYAVRVHRAIGFRPSRFRVVPNGIDVNLFRPDDELRRRVRSEWNVPEGMPLIGTIGRYNPYKGYGTLFSALSLLRREGLTFQCALVGTGMDAGNAALVSQLEAAGLLDCVLLSGPRPDVPSVMNAFDLFSLSSVAEGFPSVLIEAMACGVPCVTTAVGDAPQIVGDTGWVVPPRDAGAMASALRSALASFSGGRLPTERREETRNRVVSTFSLDRMVAGFSSIWQSN